MEISLEELEQEVLGLEFSIEKISSHLENALLALDNVKSLVKYLKEIKNKEEKVELPNTL